MEALFSWINRVLTEGIFFAVAASFIWGVLSVALSPCHLTSIPLIIGFVNDSEERGVRGRFILSLLFSLGILISIGAIGVVTVAAGRVAGDVGTWGNWLGALVFTLIGFHFLDVIPLNFPGISKIPFAKKGKGVSFLVGLLFGVALGPCTFAFMAPVLAVSFIREGSLAATAAIFFMYGAGHSLLILLAGTFTASLQNYLRWNSSRNWSMAVKRVSGLLLLCGALYYIWKAV